MKTNDSMIKVWDPFIRIFHWSLLAAFTVGWFTQHQNYKLHLQAGYLMLGLILLRLLWGLAGPEYAAFKNFIYSPKTIYVYLKSLTGGHPKRYIGHNPAGGVMVLLLLIGLLTICISGIALDAAENWSGPLAEMNLFHHTGLIQSIHVISTNVLLALITLHILGVIYSSIRHHENLPKSMITGKKSKS